MTEMSTEPQGLLDAMLPYIQQRGSADAVRVKGYRERSYNLGYCETCWEMVTEVRIFYVTADGTEKHYQVEYQSLGSLICDLTKEQDEVRDWAREATFETDDERWDREEAHDFDDEVPGD